MSKKTEKNMEIALPFVAAGVVFVAATWQPLVAAVIGMIGLMGIGAYHYFFK